MKPHRRAARRAAGFAIALALAVGACWAFAGCASTTVLGPSSGDGDPSSGDGADAPRGDAPDGGGDGEDAGDGAVSPGRRLCRVSCITSDYCIDYGGGTCTNKVCIRSTGGIEACKVDPDCVPYGSSFEIDKSCTTRSDCLANEACIAFQGRGICHKSPNATDAATPCSSYYAMVEIDWPSVEGPTVKICARTSYVCDEGKCHDGCNDDTECTTTAYPKCDIGRHKCVCSGASCAGNAFTGDICLPDGRCGCSADEHCNVTGHDRCYGDMCGCSGDKACADLVPTAVLVCVP